MLTKLIDFALIRRNVILVFAALALITSVINYFLGTKITAGVTHTHYNNYVIFKYSFLHLIHDQNLYQYYVTEHNDLYKYSPAFAVLFGFFNLFPDLAGLFIWNLLNTITVVAGIYLLPGLNRRQQGIALLILAPELLTSIQNTQSNGLIAGLIILSIGLLERKNHCIAALLIVVSIYIKLFGAVAFALFLLYPNKLKTIGYSIFWFLLFAFLPLIVVDWNQLIQLYKNWFEVLSVDHATNAGFSIFGWLNTWFNSYPDKLNLLIAGVVIFCLPLLRYNLYKNTRFRLLMLASVLMWVIIFNHRSESSTVVIAVCGAAIWFVASPDNILNRFLIIFLVVVTSFSGSDVVPGNFRHEIVYPYMLKIFPCIILYCKLLYDLLTLREEHPVICKS